MKYLLGLDQGTSGTKAYLMDFAGNRVGLGYVPTELIRLRPDWIEQEPRAVAAGAAQAIEQTLHAARCAPSDVAAIGIASQRGTDFIWNARTAQPVANAITWQDLRTLPLIEELDRWEHANERRYRLGYFPGPWCASMHLAWRARHQPEFQAVLHDEHARIGMSAGWLIAALGRPSQHLHDYSLTQKTGLWDFRRGAYWAEWIDQLQLSLSGLPASGAHASRLRHAAPWRRIAGSRRARSSP